jgi:hypothetical protein
LNEAWTRNGRNTMRVTEYKTADSTVISTSCPYPADLFPVFRIRITIRRTMNKVAKRVVANERLKYGVA